MRRIVIVTATVLLMCIATSALGGGTWMETSEETYQSGDTVKAVAYVGASVTDEPVLARLNLVPMEPATENEGPLWHEVGPVITEPTGLGGYMSTRVSIEFELPPEMAPGNYMVEIRDESGRFLGDLIGLSLLVGIEASEPQWIEWPLDEPLIADLSDDAVIAGPGFSVTVADLRAGRYPAGAEDFMLNPEVLDPTQVVTTTTTQVAPSMDTSEAGVIYPATSSPAVPVDPAPSSEQVESAEEPGSVPRLGMIALGLGLVVLVVGSKWMRRLRHPSEVKRAERPRELEGAGRR